MHERPRPELPLKQIVSKLLNEAFSKR